MSHVAGCAHVVMNAEYDCGGGDQECVVWHTSYIQMNSQT